MGIAAVPLFVAPPPLLQALENFAASLNNGKQVLNGEIQERDVTVESVKADWERYTSIFKTN